MFGLISIQRFGKDKNKNGLEINSPSQNVNFMPLSASGEISFLAQAGD